MTIQHEEAVLCFVISSAVSAIIYFLPKKPLDLMPYDVAKGIMMMILGSR